MQNHLKITALDAILLDNYDELFLRISKLKPQIVSLFTKELNYQVSMLLNYLGNVEFNLAGGDSIVIDGKDTFLATCICQLHKRHMPANVQALEEYFTEHKSAILEAGSLTREQLRDISRMNVTNDNGLMWILEHYDMFELYSVPFSDGTVSVRDITDTLCSKLYDFMSRLLNIKAARFSDQHSLGALYMRGALIEAGKFKYYIANFRSADISRAEFEAEIATKKRLMSDIRAIRLAGATSSGKNVTFNDIATCDDLNLALNTSMTKEEMVSEGLRLSMNGLVGLLPTDDFKMTFTQQEIMAEDIMLGDDVLDLCDAFLDTMVPVGTAI